MAFTDIRINAIKSSCTRVRSAIFVSIVVCATALIAVWNSYFTWDRYALDPSGRGIASQSPEQAKIRDVATLEEIRLYVDNRAVNVGLLGLRISANDLPVIAGLTLLIVSLYAALAARRANRDIAIALIETQRLGPEEMRSTYFGIRSELILNTASVSEQAISSLNYRFSPLEPEQTKIALAVALLIYLPALTILCAVASDAYYALYFYDADFGRKFVWGIMTWSQRVELLAWDIPAVIVAALTWRYNRLVLEHMSGIMKLMAEFAASYCDAHGCSIYDPLQAD